MLLHVIPSFTPGSQKLTLSLNGSRLCDRFQAWNGILGRTRARVFGVDGALWWLRMDSVTGIDEVSPRFLPVPRAVLLCAARASRVGAPGASLLSRWFRIKHFGGG